MVASGFFNEVPAGDAVDEADGHPFSLVSRIRGGLGRVDAAAGYARGLLPKLVTPLPASTDDAMRGPGPSLLDRLVQFALA